MEPPVVVALGVMVGLGLYSIALWWTFRNHT